MVELLIQHEKNVFIPATLEGITLTSDRQGSPSELKFKILKDNVLNVSEGDAVRLSIDGTNIFYGFIFDLDRDKGETIDVIAYDQLRYLKNKDTYVFTGNTATDIINMIAKDFNLQTGNVENTGYKIPSLTCENMTLLDMIQSALDATLENQSKLYVMYDDVGKITLKSLESMQLDVLIDAETGENFRYTSSINEKTYNKVKLTFDNEKTGKREVYIAQHGENMNRWGVLQYFDTLREGENGQAKADALLKLYNKKTRNLQIKNAFGDVRVRAGSMIVVQLDLGDIKLQNLMLVEKCKHEFKLDQHFMTLNLRGGEFVV